MNRLTDKQLARILYNWTSDVPKKELENRMNVFIKFLYQQHALSSYPRILEYFKQIYLDKHDIIKVQLFYRYPLSKSEKNVLITNIQKQFPNKTIELEEKENSQILGGFILKYKDTVIDASFKQTLKQLRTHLKQSLSS